MSESEGTTPCPNCGMPVASDDLFCGSCGQRLDVQEQRDSGDAAGIEEPPSRPSMPGPPPPPAAPVALPRAAAPQSAPPQAASPAPAEALGSASSSKPAGKWRRRLLMGLALFGAFMLCSITLAVVLAFLAQMSP
ncbi:MAG: zinc ribbon domain-containing protein [Chloroflexota bacterium]